MNILKKINMPYNQILADKVRILLPKSKKLTEKKMFGGLAFMLNGKMCLGVDKDDLIVRCLPDDHESLLKKTGARNFDLSGSKKPMRGWLLIDKKGTGSVDDLNWWVQLALKTNKKL